MKRPGHSLRLVTTLLRGQLPQDAEWPTVLETANRGWLGPALYLALDRAAHLNHIPPVVRDYLALLHGRNCDRNRRLLAQLLEAIGALNRRGIEPILLKGAINLFTADIGNLGARMLSDLDLSIAPAEMAPAQAALMTLGYRNLGSAREMARPDDVGVIEFHDRPSERSAPYLSRDLRASSPPAERDGAVARIPCPTAHALHLIVHDMIKEGDYWGLRIDLRHLHDLAELAGCGDGIEWRRLRAALPDGPARQALVAQATALADLYAIQIPPDLRPDRMAMLRHGARLIGADRGLFGSLLRLIGDLSLGLNRIAVGYTWRGASNFARQVYRRLASRSVGSRL